MSNTESDTPDRTLKMPAEIVDALRCPGRPAAALRRDGDRFVVDDARIDAEFPIVNGTPILINEANSVFRISDFTAEQTVTTMDLRDDAERLDTPLKKFKNFVGRLVPAKSRSINDFTSGAALDQLLEENPGARVLVIGAGDSRFTIDRDVCVVYTDVALASDTHLIADAHDIPFDDDTFDAVFAIAVLEHVANPYTCVAEMQRVLKPEGYVYAVTPFMQQVHMGRYDFTRFTAMGHRRLFRWFDEHRAGVANGPAMAVVWSIEYMVSSMSEKHTTRSLLRSLVRLFTWPLLWIDCWIGHKAGAYDCASGYYFFGRLRDAPIDDREIVKTYKGLN